MKISVQGGFANVVIEPAETRAFNRTWPRSPIPSGARFQLEFDVRNGDIVNITAWDMSEYGKYLPTETFDGDALLAFVNDAGNKLVDGGVLPQWARK